MIGSPSRSKSSSKSASSAVGINEGAGMSVAGIWRTMCSSVEFWKGIVRFAGGQIRRSTGLPVGQAVSTAMGDVEYLVVGRERRHEAVICCRAFWAGSRRTCVMRQAGLGLRGGIQNAGRRNVPFQTPTQKHFRPLVADINTGSPQSRKAHTTTQPAKGYQQIHIYSVTAQVWLSPDSKSGYTHP